MSAGLNSLASLSLPYRDVNLDTYPRAADVALPLATVSNRTVSYDELLTLPRYTARPRSCSLVHVYTLLNDQ